MCRRNMYVNHRTECGSFSKLQLQIVHLDDDSKPYLMQRRHPLYSEMNRIAIMHTNVLKVFSNTLEICSAMVKETK